MNLKYYIVGGACRDKLMGRESKDLDLAVIAESFDEALNDFKSSGGQVFIEKPEFVTFRGKHPKLGVVDVRLARKDGEYKDNRHPDKVILTDNIVDDLNTRDFTINAIAQDFDTGEIIDPFNGRRDIEAQYIRCVGDTETRLREDIIRLLRAFKFAIRFDFDINFNIWECARNKEIIDLFDNIPSERIYEELKEMFNNKTLDSLIIFEKLPLLRNKIFGEKGVKLFCKVNTK